jgi:hypothetical protein
MSILKKLKSFADNLATYEEKLYRVLMSPTYMSDNYRRENLGENMEVVNTLFIDYWKPRFLLDHDTKCAYEFMNENASFVGVEDSDIDWASLKTIPEEYLERVESRNACFPSFIRSFKNNVAEVCWQLNPDGRYWMDEDGFGMTPDEEFNIYGFIDRTGKVVIPYQAVRDEGQLNRMRIKAESIVRDK